MNLQEAIKVLVDSVRAFAKRVWVIITGVDDSLAPQSSVMDPESDRSKRGNK